MNALEDLQVQIRNDLPSFAAIAAMALLSIGYAVFLATSIMPQWQTRAALETELGMAQQALAEKEQARDAVPGEIQAQIADQQLELNEAAGTFLAEDEVTAIINNLYIHADESSTHIANLQARPVRSQQGEESAVTSKRVFQLQAEGTIPHLMGFVSRVHEGSLPTFVIKNVNIREGRNGPAILTLELELYTSPYTDGDTSNTPVATSFDPTVEAEVATDLAPTPSPSATSAPTSAPTATEVPVCDCSTNIYDCRDFPDRESAQACYDYCGGVDLDVHLLDADLDGISCETIWP